MLFIQGREKCIKIGKIKNPKWWFVGSKVHEFINGILDHYPCLVISFYYDENEDEYYIWHEDVSMEFYDRKFHSVVAKLAREKLFDNGIYNFTFSFGKEGIIYEL